MKSIKYMLEENDRVIEEAGLSKKALIITWASIPGVFLIFYLIVYLPSFLSLLIKGKIKEFLLDQANLESEKESVFDFVIKDIFGVIPPFIWFIICFFISLLVIAWLCWSLYMTKQYYQNELFYTKEEVFARSKKQILNVPLKKVNNIYVENSLWGRLFNYGTITIVSNRGSISVSNIHKARDFAKKLSKVTIEDEDHFSNL